MFVCAGNGEEFDFAVSIGVGLIQSAICLTEICTTQKVESLVFCGSAGSYDREIKLLDLYLSTQASQIESSVLLGKSYTPISLTLQSPQNVSCETIQHLFALNLPQSNVNSSNYITTDIAHAQWMKKKGILLENMEFYSVLAVANRFNIPAIGIFCVSNYTDEHAHEEFLKNHSSVKEKLKNICSKLL